MAFRRRGFRRRRPGYTPSPAYTPPASTPWTPERLRVIPPRDRPDTSIDCVFASMSDFLTLIEAPSPCPLGERESLNNAPSDAWDLGAGYAGALALAHQGWPEGAAMARDYSEALFARVSAKMTKNVFLFSDEGMTWDLSRVVANEPECWLARHEVEGTQEGPRYIRVVVNVSASFNIDARVLLARGAVIAALVELLEYAGHRCEITVAHAAVSSRRIYTATTVKHFSEPLDMPLVAYAVAHPSVLRRLIFAVYESRSADERSAIGVGGGYGRPIDLATEERGDIYCPAMSSGDAEVPWQDAKASVAWITHHLKLQGVHLALTDDDC